MLIRREGSLERSPAATIAAVLAALYALGLLTLAGSLVVDRMYGNDVIAHLRGYEVRGWAFVVVACIAGALLLAFGTIAVWRGRRGYTVIAPLGLIVVIGCIGEPIDIISGNPLGDNLIGLLIIVAAALPLVLLLLPRRAAAATAQPSE
ncbi:hypothetical protein [Diaminobutyricibacter tongyongensis]|uniref:hypothetical protein n=1 Tax=Leifsonia tongyongensis TaxID=1268043 RepID=UPI00308437FB